MAQVRKEKIKNRIDKAALQQFYEHGFTKATMMDIAREAGIATGNLYRYYKSKEELFESVIPEKDANEAFSLAKARLVALNGMNVNEAIFSEEIKRIDAQIVEFYMKHKMQIIVATDKSQGTKYENVKEELCEMMICYIREYMKNRGKKDFFKDKIKNGVFRIIMRNFVQAIIEIIKISKTEKDFAYAFKSLVEYQEMGMDKFLD